MTGASNRSGRDSSRAAGRTGPRPALAADREAILRRVAAEASGRVDLAELFSDVLDHSVSLFAADHVGLWLIEEGDHPLQLAAQRGLPEAFLRAIAAQRRDPRTAGWRAIARQRTVVLTDPTRRGTSPELRSLYRQLGIRTSCFVPLVFAGDALGLLVLYHDERHRWTAEEVELARSLTDQMAISVANARLARSVRGAAARLAAIQDLGERLSRVQEVDAIGEAIVTEVRDLYDSDTARVYTVNHLTGMCEPVAFRGIFLGVENPAADVLRVPIGRGLTGWVAANATPLRVPDSRREPRRLVIGSDEEPETMLLAPMTFENTVRGVVVVSKKGVERYSADDLTTLAIFAGVAAQALVNAESISRLRGQQSALEQRLAGQRSLLEVNESLLSARDPGQVLDVIADSLKRVVRYDNLTIYRLDRERGVRVAVLARDRYADVIMAEQIPVGVGLTGWAIDRGEAVLANDAQNDPRATQIPGTPMEPESLIVVPLKVGGEVLGTLNIGRMGLEEAHFSEDEFELVQLFAGQASIAVQTAEALSDAETRARRDALTGLPNHGAFQADLDACLAPDAEPAGADEQARRGQLAVLMLDLDGFKAYNDARGHPAGDRLLRRIADALESSVRQEDRVYRYGGDEFAAVLPGAGPAEARVIADRLARAIDRVGAMDDGPPVTVSIGLATLPEDGETKGQLIDRADRVLYLGKAERRSARVVGGAIAADAVDPSRLHSGFYDTLTGLPDRQLFLDRVGQALVRARPGEPARLAVLQFDLDRFKVINESLGHAAGDRLLAAVAVRLAGALRPGDMIARLGGDEFGVLLNNLSSDADVVAISCRLLDALAEPFRLAERDTYVGASVGIAVGREGGTTATDLLREADVALYRAKSDRAVPYAVYTPAMRTSSLERLDLEADLRRAVERGELRLHYQPLVDLATGKVTGHESLVRWQHPARGLLPPADFIPLAEETGLIAGIGEWVLAEACRQNRAWQIARADARGLTVSVNLSAHQFTRHDLFDRVAEVLDRTGLAAADLELEITESVAMSAGDATATTLRRLHEQGVRLVLDDFGTGYSSLSYLARLPLHMVKVDRAFVAGLPGAANEAIIGAVVSLARGLGIKVTAEGIERPAELAAIRALGCDLGQGYLFAPPMPAEAAEAFFAAGVPAVGRATGRAARAVAAA
ncbi:MAG: diguanylate cyclase/phosphodiesterase with sensor(s) [Chloroflexi bacterium]|nr:diguanylate cyclase/phosphodiesterase with sensor(s) [Chloroflexota bacterium]